MHFFLLITGALCALRGFNFHRHARQRLAPRTAKRQLRLRVFDHNSRGHVACTDYSDKAIQEAKMVTHCYPSHDIQVYADGNVKINNCPVFQAQPEDTVIATQHSLLVESPGKAIQEISIPKREKVVGEGVNLKLYYTSPHGGLNALSYSRSELQELGRVRFSYPRYHIEVDAHGTVKINGSLVHQGKGDIVATECKVSIYEGGTKVKEINVHHI